jgi:hypothetical protein
MAFFDAPVACQQPLSLGSNLSCCGPLRPADVSPPRGSFSCAVLERLRAVFRAADLCAARLRPTRFLLAFFADFLPDDFDADAMRILSTRLG